MSLPLTTIGSNEAGLVEKVMRSSLHFASLSSNLFMVARVEKVSTAFWMLLSWPLLTVSETVVSSTYFHRSDPVSHGLTSAGLSRINQSIELFCYAILGSQVDVRSSIAGSQGSSIETQRQFLSMVEDAIRNPDLGKSVQRFQLAIESAKVRLDLAISPGTWLLPSKMVVNTESVVGYNNKLKKATSFMKIGVNSDLNIPVKRSAPKHNFGSDAVKLPHSGVETQNNYRETKEKQVTKSETKETQVTKIEAKTVSPSHETNLNVLIIVAGGLAWFLFR